MFNVERNNVFLEDEQMLDEEKLSICWRCASRDLAGGFMKRDCCLVDDLVGEIVKDSRLLEIEQSQSKLFHRKKKRYAC